MLRLNNDQLSPFWMLNCKIVFDQNLCAEKARFLLDTGADIGLLPKWILPEQVLQNLEPDVTCIKGIGEKSVKSLGRLTVSISENGHYYDNVRFSVVDYDVPAIIGMSFIKHPSVKMHSICHETDFLKLTRYDNTESVFKLDSTRDVRPVRLTVGPESSRIHVARFQNLSQKLKYIESELGVKLSHSNASELEQFADLIIKYENIFGPETGNFPGEVEFLTQGPPRCARQRPVPSQFEEAVDSKINQMLEMGIIEECPNSRGWLTTLLVVPKADGSPRICLDFKQTVNKSLIEEETFVQQSSEEIFNSLDPRNKYFSSCDLKAGYWQLKLTESCKYKTAFQWRRKQYCFSRLPFGLTCAGNLFTKCISQALLSEKFDPKRVICYLDDITIGSPTFSEFLKNHERVFAALSRFDLKLNPEKCQFFRSEVRFLGRIISQGTMRPDPQYVSDVLKIKPPKCKKGLQTLIGSLVWLKSFIGTRMGERVRVTSFSALMDPILKCGKNKVFFWSPDADSALSKIKKRLMKSPFISMVDPGLPFILATDASKESLGGVLMQKFSETDFRIVALVSHTFSGAEVNWSTTEKECYGIVYCLKKLEYFLLGRTFTVQTDHKSLCWLDSTGFKNHKVRRWQDEISRFSFCIQYIKGRENVLADFLSRCDQQDRVADKNEPVSPKGQFWQVNKSKLQLYIPSHCRDLIETKGEKVYLNPIGKSDQKSSARVLFSLTDSREPDKITLGPAAFLVQRKVEQSAVNFDIFQIAEDQRKDEFLAPIIEYLIDENCSNSDLSGVMDKLNKKTLGIHNFGVSLRKCLSMRGVALSV